MGLFVMSNGNRQFLEKGAASGWGEIEPDGRLHVPIELTVKLSWYRPKVSCEVVLECRERGAVLVHPGHRWKEIEDQLVAVLEEFPADGWRRIAIAYSVFHRAKFGQSNRRIHLTSAIIDHLGVPKPSRVHCLYYSDTLEILSESKYTELCRVTHADVLLELPADRMN